MNPGGSTLESGTARRGLTLIEVMASLVITTGLLVAAATAFTASAKAIQVNSDFFRAVQAARVSMNQMLAEIRKADSVVDVTSTYIDVARPLSVAPTELYRRFAYDNVNHVLTLQIFYNNGNSPSPVYELATNLTSNTSFGPAITGTDANKDTNAILRTPIALEVSVGNNVIRLNGTASPRRALDTW